MRLPSSRSATGWGATVDFSVSGLPTWRVSFPAMGTRFDLVGHGGDLRAITEAACSLVDAHEQLWSVFRDSSDVSRLNASQGWTDVDASTDRLLVDALALSEATGGVFTPLIGAFAAHCGRVRAAGAHSGRETLRRSRRTNGNGREPSGRARRRASSAMTSASGASLRAATARTPGSTSAE